MTLPDHEFDPDDNFRHAFDDEDDMDLDDTEALVWNLLVLINPGDEETALRQFAAYRDATGEAGTEPDQVLWTLKDAIDWTSGFYVDWKDTETFIDCVPAARETVFRMVVHFCHPPVAGTLSVPVSLTPLKWT